MRDMLHAGWTSSPRVRRYFLPFKRLQRGLELFSARAEVFPRVRKQQHRKEALLRACGGISGGEMAILEGYLSSPRVRRYFLNPVRNTVAALLFSARAEVFPIPHRLKVSWRPLLRACGGISYYGGVPKTGEASSPRVRRYFRVHG